MSKFVNSIDTIKCATDTIEENSFIELIQSKYLTTIYPELYEQETTEFQAIKRKLTDPSEHQSRDTQGKILR